MKPKLIDGCSLEKWVKIRLKWHKDLTVEEVIEMIHNAPEIEVKKNDGDLLREMRL